MTINYKGTEIRLLPPIKRYVNAISRKLRLPYKIKARVMCDFATTICARHEQGESYEDIMKCLGTPAQVAAELNEQMKEYSFRKSPWRFVFLGIAVLSILWLIIYFSIFGLGGTVAGSIGVIGAADGPTAIFVTADPPLKQAIVCGALLIASTLAYFRLGRLKKK